MKESVESTRAFLIEIAIKKYDQLMKGSAFQTDFAAADIIKRLVTEIRLLSLENKNYKKMIEYNKAYLKKKENESNALRKIIISEKTTK